MVNQFGYPNVLSLENCYKKLIKLNFKTFFSMKTKLLFTVQNSNNFYFLLVFCLCLNLGWSQTNLVQNSTCEDHTIDVNDNADAFDMTPPSSVDVSVSSPYRAIWNNSDLDSWLTTNCGDTDEQPGSSSDGNKFGPLAGLGRGVKLSETCRRLYQVVPVTPGTNYTFFIDSRSEAENVPSEVFILNEEIITEAGLENGAADTRVDAYMMISNDFNATKATDTEDTFTRTSFSFTASASIAVIYVRATAAIDGATEVFYDNISLFDTASLSTKDVLASSFKVYPNPVKDYITIESKSVKLSSVELYNILGAKVLGAKALTNNRLNVSGVAKGIYLLKINAEGASTTKKIVIE